MCKSMKSQKHLIPALGAVGLGGIGYGDGERLNPKEMTNQLQL